MGQRRLDDVLQVGPQVMALLENGIDIGGCSINAVFQKNNVVVVQDAGVNEQYKRYRQR